MNFSADSRVDRFKYNEQPNFTTMRHFNFLVHLAVHLQIITKYASQITSTLSIGSIGYLNNMPSGINGIALTYTQLFASDLIEKYIKYVERHDDLYTYLYSLYTCSNALFGMEIPFRIHLIE